MSYVILTRRKLKADLPTSAPLGELIVTTDTNELFVGTGPGIAPVVGSPGSFFPLPTEAAVSGPDDVGVPPTRYPVQVGVFDGTNVRRLKGDAGGNASVNVENFPSGGASDSTLAAVGAAVLTLTKPSDTQPVSAASLPLPTGASTETTLAAIKAKTDNLDVALSTRTKPADTQAVSVIALPLPAGASTEATLAAIKAKTDNLDVALSTRTKPADTQPVSAVSLPLPAGAATEASLGTDGAAPPSIAGTGIRGWLRAIFDKLTAGLAVTGTFWQATQPISGAVTANAGTNLNTSALALETGGNLAAIAGTVTAAKVQVNNSQVSGTAVDTNSGNKSAGTQRVVIATDQPALTNALKVDPSGVTSPVSLAALPALAAGTNLIGTSASPSETSTIYNGTAALTPKFAVIVASASGATQVVAAVTSKKIRVLRFSLVANAAVNAKFQSHVTPTDKTGLYYLAANGGWVEPFCPVGIFETIAGEALDINLSGAVAVGGCMTYVEV